MNHHETVMWNLWHGCHKCSEGCRYCYVYRRDEQCGIDSTIVRKTKNFDLPLRKNRAGNHKVSAGTTVYTCFTSDFFVEDADTWRSEAWEMIRLRRDLFFFMITKRIDRFHVSLPSDWGEGYDHVTICCTIENQDRADYRLPIYQAAPIKHKILICEPLLSKIDLRSYEIGTWIEEVVVGGESGIQARPCRFEWIMEIRNVCEEHCVPFHFKQTGAHFIKDGRVYHIKRHIQHSQARKAGIDIR